MNSFDKIDFERIDKENGEGIGLYIHVPFCKKKCPYCDFYSVYPKKLSADSYMSALSAEMEKYKGEKVRTVYFGGGTPSLMGEAWLVSALEMVKDIFLVDSHAEITLEVNPGDLHDGFFSSLNKAGFNRVSIGMQSGDDNALAALGRRHTKDDTVNTVKAAKQGGFKNISLDVMLAIPDMTEKKLRETLEFAVWLNVPHISAYILKIEEGTPFAKGESRLNLPCGDDAADFYFQTVEALNSQGFIQYEISNFSKPGYESRHNLLYWECREYLGFGPSAHSFYKGKRFYYPRDLEEFLKNPQTIADGSGGDIAEYIMLKLRLAKGVSRRELETQFAGGGKAFDMLLKQAEKCPPEYMKILKSQSRKLQPQHDETLALTAKGFAMSNAVLSVLLDGIM